MFRYLATKGRKDLRFITLFVTNRCQLRCSHCFNYKAKAGSDQELSCDEYEKIASSIGKFEILLISGGEPYLRPDLFAIIDIFKKISRVKCVSIASNGFDSERIINKTREYLAREKSPLSVNLSIDGMRDVHNRIRGSSYSFDHCLNTLDGLWKLKKSYPHFYPGVNLVLMDLNSYDVEDLFEYLEARYRGINMEVELLRPLKRDRNLSLPGEEVIEKVHKKVLANKNEMKNRKRLKDRLINFIALSEKAYLFKVQRKVLGGERFSMKCLAGQTNAVIGASGEVSFCEPLSPINNLRECNYRFWDIWYSKKAWKLRDKIRRDRCSCTHCVNIYTSIEYSLWTSLIKAPLARLREICYGS